MFRSTLRLFAGAVTALTLVAMPSSALAAGPANDHFANASLLSGFAWAYNDTATAEATEPAHAGSVAGKSLWWRWTATGSGTTTLDTCASDFDTVLGIYTGDSVGALTTVASSDESDVCAVGSSQSSATFTAVAGTTYRIAVDGYNGGTGADFGEIGLSISPPPPANDNFADAIVIPAATTEATFTGSNVSATSETGEPSHTFDSGGRSVWWTWTPSANATVGIRTCASGFDTELAVYTGPAGATFGDLTRIASNGDQDGCGSDGWRSYVDVSVTAGTTYWIAVDGYDYGDGDGAETGDISLLISAPLADRDGDGKLNDADCAPDDGHLPSTTDTDCNGVADSSQDADGDGIANGSDCAPSDGSKPNRTGVDANCNGVLDVNEDADGDGIANGADCAPADGAKPNRAGTDANCDGVIDVTPLILTGGTANATFTGGVLADRFTGGTGSETFRGMAGNDNARGNGGNDKLYGGLGNDHNDGGAGADLVNGDAGNDTGLGGAGNDVVNGGAGTDTSRGGIGNDRISCGPGVKDRAFGDAGVDSINCFDRTPGDIINGGAGRDTCIGDKRDIFRACEKVVKK